MDEEYFLKRLDELQREHNDQSIAVAELARAIHNGLRTDIAQILKILEEQKNVDDDCKKRVVELEGTVKGFGWFINRTNSFHDNFIWSFVKGAFYLLMAVVAITFMSEKGLDFLRKLFFVK